MDLEVLRDTPPWDWPRNAGTLLKKTLLDNGAPKSGRLIAAGLAGDLVVMDDEMAGALLSILQRGTEPEELRATAAVSLGPVLELADTDGFSDPDDVPIAKSTFNSIQNTLRQIYLDDKIPKIVRRRALEASVRAPQAWHTDAIAAARSSEDRDWILTAVFAMQWVKGFDAQILEALNSADAEIHIEAVEAAGNWELDAAWSHTAALVSDPATPKLLLLAAIEAVGNIRPREAGGILAGLADSHDEEIAEAAKDAMTMADVMAFDDHRNDDEEDDEEMDTGKWIF